MIEHAEPSARCCLSVLCVPSRNVNEVQQRCQLCRFWRDAERPHICRCHFQGFLDSLDRRVGLSRNQLLEAVVHRIESHRHVVTKALPVPHKELMLANGHVPRRPIAMPRTEVKFNVAHTMQELFARGNQLPACFLIQE